jgi:hypothetical protein
MKRRLLTLLCAGLAIAAGTLVVASPAQAALPTPYGQISPFSAITKCLDNAFSRDNNHQIVQWSCVNQSSQLWRVQYGWTGLVFIVNQYSGKCLTVLGGSTDKGAAVVQYDCSTANYNGMWNFIRTTDPTPSGGGGFLIQNGTSGLCLNIAGGSTANGARLIQWTCDWQPPNTNFYFPYNPFPGA